MFVKGIGKQIVNY